MLIAEPASFNGQITHSSEKRYRHSEKSIAAFIRPNGAPARAPPSSHQKPIACDIAIHYFPILVYLRQQNKMEAGKFVAIKRRKPLPFPYQPYIKPTNI
jgi:hypothetical protein